nr:MAG TPA: hypothetical protein [Inoviridae sp.]
MVGKTAESKSLQTVARSPIDNEPLRRVFTAGYRQAPHRPSRPPTARFAQSPTVALAWTVVSLPAIQPTPCALIVNGLSP